MKVNGKTVKVGQCNNFWIFPGVGFGSVMSKSKKVTVRDAILARSPYSIASQRAYSIPRCCSPLPNPAPGVPARQEDGLVLCLVSASSLPGLVTS